MTLRARIAIATVATVIMTALALSPDHPAPSSHYYGQWNSADHCVWIDIHPSHTWICDEQDQVPNVLGVYR